MPKLPNTLIVLPYDPNWKTEFESNLNISYCNCGVVWLTTSPDPANHGLKFDSTIPAEMDKAKCFRTVMFIWDYDVWQYPVSFRALFTS